MTVEKGTYLIIDRSWGLGKKRYRELLIYAPEYHKVIAPHIEGRMRYFSLGTGKRGWTKKRKLPAQFSTTGAVYPLNWVRIPPPDVQSYFKETDEKIKALQEERRAYINEHYLEWDIAELSQFQSSGK